MSCTLVFTFWIITTCCQKSEWKLTEIFKVRSSCILVSSISTADKIAKYG